MGEGGFDGRANGGVFFVGVADFGGDVVEFLGDGFGEVFEAGFDLVALLEVGAQTEVLVAGVAVDGFWEGGGRAEVEGWGWLG